MYLCLSSQLKSTTQLVLACILEHYTMGNLWLSLQDNVFKAPLDALKIMVPSLLYLVQNSLLYVALSNLSAPLFQVTYQAKLVTTALVSVVMLQRSYSTQQWICLVFLSLGVAIVVLGEGGKKKEETESAKNQSLSLGLIAVSIACFSSALAGVYFEKVLKRKDATPVSLWMRNIQMAFFSIVIALFQYAGSSSSTTTTMEAQDVPFLHGFTGWVWILVGLQAGGGLLVAAVIKYADNVLKGLATGVSVVVATMCSMVLFGTPLTLQFSVGAALILAAVYFFSNPIIIGRKTSSTSSSSMGAEMKPLVNGNVLPK
jgi:UDP-sugar transporter A1/2/3